MKPYRKSRRPAFLLTVSLSFLLALSGCGRRRSADVPESRPDLSDAESFSETESPASSGDVTESGESPKIEESPDSGTASGHEGVSEAEAGSETENETVSGTGTAPGTDGGQSGNVPSYAEVTSEAVFFNSSWEYAANSKIHTGAATLWHVPTARFNGHTVCVNAGHGTSGGGSVRTLCHPDGTPKVTSGTTAAGETEAPAVSSGTTFLDGTSEAGANLQLAFLLRDELLSRGYNVLMIRESDDIQLDNIARTCIANAYADCHIALHYDSTDNDKGAYFTSVPDAASYRSMEPVASHWMQHQALGENIIAGFSADGIKVFGSGSIPSDLTQTSYSTVPSIDLEVGDRGSDHSAAAQAPIAKGIADGLDLFFGR